MKQLIVKSVVIDWQTTQLEVTSTGGAKHTIPLGQNIMVTMTGYPAREEKTMQARELGSYMSKGYIIETVTFDEKFEEEK